MSTDTERFYSQRDEAAHQLDCIWKARNRAYADIVDIAARLVLETGCTEKDSQYLLDHAHDGLSDMLADIIAQRKGERDDADEAIGDAEFDLMLSRVR